VTSLKAPGAGVFSSRPARLYTIKEVGEACGLPAGAIMQLVPRTWTQEGWMYTGEQLADSVRIAANLRRERVAAADGGACGETAGVRPVR